MALALAGTASTTETMLRIDCDERSCSQMYLQFVRTRARSQPKWSSKEKQAEF